MAEHQQADGPSNPPDASKSNFTASPPPTPSYSAWRTAAHLYLPFATVALFMIFGSPFDTTGANMLCIVLSAIPTNWLATFFYPADRPEPTPAQSVRFSRKSDLYRAAILFTYRWLFGTPFDLQFFLTDLASGYLVSSVIPERPAGTKQRRSEFGVHLLWIAGNALLLWFAPAFLIDILYFVDRMIWRSAYIALVDDVVGVLLRPNLKTWKGKVVLVLTQAFTIFFACWMVLRWKMDLILAAQKDVDYQAALAALKVQQGSDEVGVEFEDDGDRYLVDDAS